MGKAFEKQTKTIEDQGQKQVEASKTKAIEGKSNDNSSNSKEIYDKILEEIMHEILKMSREINYNNSVYVFKGPTSSISLLNLRVQCILIINLKKVIKHYNK